MRITLDYVQLMVAPPSASGKSYDPNEILEYSDDALLCAIEMIESFPRPIQRLVETYTPAGEAVRAKVDLDIRLPRRESRAPGHAMETLILPVVVRSRDETLHNLKVFSDQPLSVSLLSRDEADAIVGILLDTRLRQAFPAQRLKSFGDPLDALARSLTLAVTKTSDKDDQAYKAVLSDIFNVQGSQPEQRRLLDDLCRQLTSSFFQMVEVTAIFGHRVRLNYTYDSTVHMNVNVDTRSDEYRYLSRRSRLGLRPFRFTFPVENASRTGSYHFIMEAFEGYYAADAKFLRPSRKVREENGQIVYQSQEVQALHGKLVARSPLGLPFVHLHLPGSGPTSSSIENNISVRVKFYEVPPGSLGIAFALNLVLFAILLSSQFLLDRLLISESAGSDFPLLLLALPATCGLWFQFTGASVDRARGSLIARVCILLNAVYSVIAIILFLVARTLLSGKSSIGLSIPIAWSVLVCATGMLVLGLGWALRRAQRGYRNAGTLHPTTHGGLT